MLDIEELTRRSEEQFEELMKQLEEQESADA